MPEEKVRNRDLTWWISTDSGAHDIKIYGRGTLDGNGRYLTEKENIGNHILAIMHTKRFVLDGIVIQNSGSLGGDPYQVEPGTVEEFQAVQSF